MGNTASNRIYNPENARPPVPFDADEADSAMERFIRQKYQDRVMQTQQRNNTGSTNSDEQQPPPLPPKTGSRFGFRSASNIFPLSSKARREAQPARVEFDSSSERDRSPSPPKANKQSRIFGSAVGGQDEFDLKLEKLRDMGFKDEKRNIAVLKGLGGNMEKSIETLVRLGEGTGNILALKTSKAAASTKSGPRTPISPLPRSPIGLTIDRTRENSQPRMENSQPKASNNPFDMLDNPPPIAQPQSSQSTGSMPQPQTNSNPYQNNGNTNPFGLMPSQSQYNLNQSFQNMAIAAPSQQPLFPNHTGGFPGPQQSQHQQLYQQSMTPPMPSIPQRYYPDVIYENSAQQPQQPQQQPQQNTSYNPFMQQQQQQQPQVQPLNTNFQTNPYGQQQTQNVFNAPIQQSPLQEYPPIYGNGVPQQQMNPFFNQNTPQQSTPQQGYDQQQPQQGPYDQYRQQSHPLMAQQTGRADKRSILDLYNYPQFAPTPQQPNQTQNQQATSPVEYQQQRQTSNPLSTQLAGNRNPFHTNGAALNSGGMDTMGVMGQFASADATRHVSRDSLLVDTGSWQNGRHSPDAWGTISGSAR